MSYGVDPPQPPTPGSPAASVDTPATTVLRDLACFGCSYNLRGLALSGNCPECGTPVEQSIRGGQLAFAGPAYRREIQRGLGLVLNGIALIVVSFIFTIVGATFLTDLFIVALGVAMIACCIMIAIGYWRYTTPDPGYALSEQASSARAVARVAVVVGTACLLAKTVLDLSLRAAHTHPAQMPVASGLLVLLGSGLALVQLLAWVVQFFAIMTYTAWVADRIPDHAIVRKARRYRWLLPLISILGAPVFFLGPLLAFVMYWNLLQALQKRIKALG